MSYTVVWFKRDLRVHDHAPLHHAAAQGTVLCLYVIEPSLWAQPDAALQQYHFVQESLHDLAQALQRRVVIHAQVAFEPDDGVAHALPCAALAPLARDQPATARASDWPLSHAPSTLPPLIQSPHRPSSASASHQYPSVRAGSVSA